MKYIFLLLFLHTTLLFPMQDLSQKLFVTIKKIMLCPEKAEKKIRNLLQQNADPTTTNEENKTPIHKLMDLHEELLEDFDKLHTLSNGYISSESLRNYQAKHDILQNLTTILIEKGLEFDDMFITYETDTTDSIVQMQSYLKRNFSDIIEQFNFQN